MSKLILNCLRIKCTVVHWLLVFLIKLNSTSSVISSENILQRSTAIYGLQYLTFNETIIYTVYMYIKVITYVLEATHYHASVLH